MSFETEGEARAYAHELVKPHRHQPILKPAQNRELLLAACERYGVELGAYDARLIEWLAGWPDAYAGVVAGLIRQAYESGKQAKR